MRKIIFVSFLLITVLLYASNLEEDGFGYSRIEQSSDLWFYVAENDTIYLDFGSEKFTVDTIDFVEGVVFYHKSQSDSSYFRINSISAYTKYECCSNDSIYTNISKVEKSNCVDSKGEVNSKKLYWRSLKYSNFEVVYNFCPAHKLKQYDKVLDSVLSQSDSYRMEFLKKN